MENILVVYNIDDNFGDILIKHCFTRLIKVVLKNLKIEKYKINTMGLKNIDEQLITNSNMIFIAGGALFGINYLNFFEYIEKIVEIADYKKIPVYFSSTGINNINATTGTDERISTLLSKKCIKSMSIRESKDLYKNWLKDSDIEITQVCDPAVWTKHIYAKRLKSRKNSNKKIIGINVARGGLFKDNKKNWDFSDEMEYLNDLKNKLDDSPYDYMFYTNGGIPDTNTMKYFAQQYNIPNEKLIFINSTSELVETISQFDFVVAIRMHSSITSYALEIPSINLIYTDKVQYFYENINRPEFAIPLNEWNADKVFQMINDNIENKDFSYNKEYLMTLYKYLFKVLSDIYNLNNTIEMYTFQEVKKYLEEETVSKEEDFFDYTVKISSAENLYLDRFIEVRKKDKIIKEYKSKLKKQEATLDRINKKLLVRIYRKIKKIYKKFF